MSWLLLRGSIRHCILDMPHDVFKQSVLMGIKVVSRFLLLRVSATMNCLYILLCTLFEYTWIILEVERRTDNYVHLKFYQTLPSASHRDSAKRNSHISIWIPSPSTIKLVFFSSGKWKLASRCSFSFHLKINLYFCLYFFCYLFVILAHFSYWFLCVLYIHKMHRILYFMKLAHFNLY